MKKIFVFSLILFVVALTGCSNGNSKYLDCNQSVTNSGIKSDVNIHGTFEGEDIVDYGIRYDMDLSSYSDIYIKAIETQDMCTSVKSAMSSYSNSITNCKQKIENKHLVITADYDLKVLLEAATKKPTIESLKTELEKQNYACIIK